MLWLIAGIGCFVGILGTAVAFGSRLRISSLEHELAVRTDLRPQPRPSGVERSPSSPLPKRKKVH